LRADDERRTFCLFQELGGARDAIRIARWPRRRAQRRGQRVGVVAEVHQQIERHFEVHRPG
jgi:hypothetical protein